MKQTSNNHGHLGNRRAFTIVELMVTISIIALLIGMLLPGLGMVRATARATKSQSNLRQWGIGVIAWSGMNEERLPWEGLKEPNDMGTNLAQPSYWANAIPPMVGQRTYKEISEQAFSEHLRSKGTLRASAPTPTSPWTGNGIPYCKPCFLTAGR